MIQRALHFYEFGPFRLNVTERILQKGSEMVPLTPKVFDTLLVLVENCGHIVEKTQLMEQLWPDSFVEESSLTQNISLLRRALSEGQEDSYIETIPKRGYRFVAQVSERDELSNGGSGAEGQHLGISVSPRTAQASAKAHWWQSITSGPQYLTIISGLLAISLMFGLFYWVRHRKTTQDFVPRSVAVLPFKTIGTRDENDLLGLGMADALIIKLSRLDQLTVLPTSSVFRFTNRDRDPVTIGRELGVEGILDGTVQRDGDWVRVTAQLIRLSDGKTVWSGKFDEKYSGIFTLQDSISEQLSMSLRPQVATNGQTITSRLTNNTEAYQSYLTGLYFWNRRTRENLPKAIDYLEKAVTVDPNFAQAQAILADCYYLTGEDEYGNATPEEANAKAGAAVAKALELDDNLAEAHTVKAGINLTQQKMDEASREFQRALELNPNYAVGHLRYAYYLFYEFKLDEALYHMKRAQELDPVSPITNGALGGMLYNARDFDGSIKYSKRALELEPTAFAARVNLGEAYAQKRMFVLAHEAFDTVREKNPAYVYWAKAYAYGLAGQRESAIKSIEEAQKHKTPRTPVHLAYAQVYAAMGEKDKAFAEMDLTNKGRWVLAMLKYDPAFDPIRGDSRFADFLKRNGVP